MSVYVHIHPQQDFFSLDILRSTMLLERLDLDSNKFHYEYNEWINASYRKWSQITLGITKVVDTCQSPALSPLSPPLSLSISPHPLSPLSLHLPSPSLLLSLHLPSPSLTPLSPSPPRPLSLLSLSTDSGSLIQMSWTPALSNLKPWSLFCYIREIHAWLRLTFQSPLEKCYFLRSKRRP